MSRSRSSEVLVFRGAEVESRHRVLVAVTDAAGRSCFRSGESGVVTFLRSTAKPLQAAAVVASGALDRFGVTDDELAVICASHSGENRHVGIVARILERLGLDERTLRCGTHPPLHTDTAARVGARATPLHNNCSGKHAGMLALARHLDVPIGTTLDPAGPVQQRIREVVAAVCALPPERLREGIDGCSAPTFAVPLEAAARAFALLARPEAAPSFLREALDRVAMAMSAHPWLVAGTDRFDTALMEAASGRLVTKAGAEAVQGVADRESGLGLFLKVVDGSTRAAPPATLASLRRLGWLGADALARLGERERPELRNHADLVIGRVEPDVRLVRTPGARAL